MNLKEQHYIVTIANCGNITLAAKKLGITQPALSSYLANVENILGMSLFERDGRYLVPTYLGEVYLEKARKILALGDEFQQQVNQVVSGHQGRLRVGIPLRRSPHLVPSALKIFRNYYPNVELILQEGNQHVLRQLLDQDKVDLLLCNLVEPQENLSYIHICNDPVILLIQQEHPCARYAQYYEGFSRPWIDLKLFDSDVFILQHEGQSLRRYTDQILSEEGVCPVRTLQIRNIETAAQMASLGLGISFCLESYFRHMYFVSPPLAFSVGKEQLSVKFSAVYYARKRLPDYAMHFVQCLKDLMDVDAVQENPLLKKK